MTVKLIGNDDINGTSVSTAGMLWVQRFTAIAGGSLSEIRLEASSSANVMVALYSSNSGSIGSVLTSSSSTACSVGFNTIAVNPVNVVSGTVYWLAFNSSVAIVYKAASSGAVVLAKGAEYSGFVFPNNPTGFAGVSNTTLQLAGWGNLPGRPFQVIIV
jgi:hypothetical protein